MKKVNAARDQLRGLWAEIRKQVDQTGAQPGSTRCVLPLCGGLAAAVRETAVVMRQAHVSGNLPETIDTVAQLRAANDAVKGPLDSVNEMSQTTSLRLQATMDRRAKFVSTLSNIMKTISTTPSPLLPNLK